MAALAAEAAAQVDLDDEDGTERLLEELLRAQAVGAARILTERAADVGMFDMFLRANPAQAPDYKFGRTSDGAQAQPWIWQER